MKLINAEKTLKIKIANYGLAIGGKTTNLNVLCQHTWPRAAATSSPSLPAGPHDPERLLPLRAGGICGFDR
jgi:hypothetical protein